MGKVMDRDPSGRTVLITRGRLSFAESLKDKKKPARGDSDAKPAHSCNIILEANQPEFASNKDAVIAALRAACKEFKKPEDWWLGLFNDDPKQLAFRKGERFKNSTSGEVYDGYAGNLAIAAKGPKAGDVRPTLKDRYKRDVGYDDITDVCYNGTYGDFIVSFYGTDKGGTSRITCSVEAIRSHQEGDRMGGGGIDIRDDDFDDLPGDDSFGGGSTGGAADDLLGGGSGTSTAGGDLLGGGGSADLLGGSSSPAPSAGTDLLGL